MKKTLYEQPTIRTLVVRVGGCVCGSYGEKGAAGGVMGTNNYGEDDEDLF